MQTNKKIIYIDASLLSKSSCILRTYYTCLRGLRPKLNSNDIEFGTAFHLCAKIVAETKGNIGLGVREAKLYFDKTPTEIKKNKAYLTSLFLTKTCISWYEEVWEGDELHRPAEVDGQIMVEQKFAYPYYSDDELDVLLVGTIDWIGLLDSGRILSIEDYKTTSTYDPKSYFAGYALSPQLMTYLFVLKKFIEASPKEEIKKWASLPVICFINGIFLKSDTTNKGKESEFLRSDAFEFRPSQMEEYEELLRQTVDRIIYFVKNDKTPIREGMLNGSCSGGFLKCNFFDACSSIDDVCRDHILNHNFISKTYNPLKFNES